MFRQRVRDHIEAGWELETDHGDYVKLVDRGIGSIPIHILLLFTTSGFGNLLYGWYNYSARADTRFLSVDDGPPSETDPSEDRNPAVDSNSSNTTSYVFGGLLLFSGLFLSILGLSTGDLTSKIGALWLLLGGIAFFPPTKRRLRNRHGLTKFGRLRTVDHRVIYPYEDCEESCVVCGDDIVGGLLRRRRDETVVAGVPVATHGRYYNHYCQQCAKNELAVGEGPPASTAGSDTEQSSSVATNRENT